MTVEGLPQLVRACDKISKDLERKTDAAAEDVARDVVSNARNAARTPQARLAASSLTTGTSGDGATVESSSPIFTGAEFGGRARPTTQQFPPHKGKRGYFLYPSMRARADQLNKHWENAIDDAMATWDYKPGVF